MSGHEELTTRRLSLRRPALGDIDAVPAIHSDPAACGLGYRPRLAFEKHCRNYALERGGRRFLATLVRVPQLAGVFLEVETAAAREDDLAPALAAVRAVLSELGLGEADLTGELYTDAVLRAGGSRGARGAGRAGGVGGRG